MPSIVPTAPESNRSATAIVFRSPPDRPVSWAATDSIGPTRCSSRSKPWHWVSIRFRYGSVPPPASPPNRQVANTTSPSRPASIAAVARSTGSA